MCAWSLETSVRMFPFGKSTLARIGLESASAATAALRGASQQCLARPLSLETAHGFRFCGLVLWEAGSLGRLAST